MNNQFQQFESINFSSFSDWLFSLSAYEFTIMGAALGLIIAKPLTINQQNSLGNFFELVGQIILTINAQAGTLHPNSNITNPNAKNVLAELDRLSSEIEAIKRKM